MIEAALERIADALEEMLRLQKGDLPQPAPQPAPQAEAVVEPRPKAKKAKPAPEPEVVKPEPAPELTLDQLRKSLAPIDPGQGRALLGQFGVKKLSDLDPAQYAEVLAAAQEMQ